MFSFREVFSFRENRARGSLEVVGKTMGRKRKDIFEVGQASFEVVGVAGAVMLAVIMLLSVVVAFTDSTIAIGIAKSKFIKANCCGQEKYMIKGITAAELGEGLSLTITTIPRFEDSTELSTEIARAVRGHTNYNAVTINFN